MSKLDYWEKRFIEEGARKMRLEHFKNHLDNIERVYGVEAVKEELLSEKPVYGVMHHIPYPWGAFTTKPYIKEE